MRNFKFLATAIVAVMLACVLAVASFAATTPFKDVDDKKNETLSDAVSLLNGFGIAKGTSETTFGTMEHVTRQQMAAFVYRLMKSGKSIEGGSNSTPFTDLEDSTYFGYISWANGTGVIKGTSATTFNPKGGIILQDAYTMIIRALGHEKEDFVYPFSYIDKAEELGLDEGLDSVVNYTTKLTRGDVAIILYNTFFAETGKEKVEQKPVLIGNGTEWVLQKKTYNPTVAEDIYNLEVGSFEVRATPKYAFNEDKYSTEYKPLYKAFDKDTLQLVAADEDEPIAEFFCDFEESGLSGAADDYIMRAVNMFYTYSEENNVKEVEKIYFVEAAHKVLETTSATISLVEGKENDDYYKYTRGSKVGTKDEISDYEKADGKIVVGNEEIYCFKAPYSYLKPDFSTELSAELREEAKNAKNLKLVDIICLDPEEGTYSYYVDTDKPIDNASDIITNLQLVYNRGVYKLKFFDVDGDGIYEYAHYMPATYGFMDGDDNMYFNSDMEGNKPSREAVRGSDIDVSFKPVIYYNGAKISGASFAEGDMVLAYLNPEANMIEVITTVKPYKGFVNQIRPANAMIRIDGQQFQTAYTWRILEEFGDGDFGPSSIYAQYHLTYGNHDFFDLKDFSGGSNTFSQILGDRTNMIAAGELFEVYAYKINGWTNCLIWYDHLEESAISYALDEIAIPVGAHEGRENTVTKSTFDAELADSVQYVKAYFNGKVSYIPLDLEDMYPELNVNKDGVINIGTVVDSLHGNQPAYVDKICKVSVNSKGHYTLTPLLHAYDDENEYIGVNRDSTVLKEEDNKMQYGNDLDMETGFIVKSSGGRYKLQNAAGETLLGDNDGEYIDYFNITGNTRIIIKNKVTDDPDDDEYEYLEFDQTTFKGTVESELKNIQYILRANPDSTTKADLLLLYAEAVEFEFKQKAVNSTWRIVAASEIAPGEDGEYRHFYTLFDPYTGTVEENVPSKESEEKAKDLGDPVEVGTVIEIKNGFIDESNDILGTIDTSKSEGLVYISSYDTEEGLVSFVPVEAVEAALEEGGEICCGDELESFVELFGYEGAEKDIDGKEFKLGLDSDGQPKYYESLFYQITDDTVVTVLTSEKAGEDALEKGEFALADVAKLASASKDYKCYNTKVLNKKQEYVTDYAEYVKAYVYASEDAEEEDELPVAEFILIVVNGDEQLIFTDYDENFYPDSHE